jgi:hypothetical protein
MKGPALFLLLAGVAVSAALAQPQPNPIPARAPHLKSPEVAPDLRVTFRLYAPKADLVTLNGSWVNATNLPMTKDDAGVWTATVTLTPQLYGYWFLVDGVRALDPSNSETERDGGRFNTMLMVSGPESAIWDFKDVPHGTLEQVWYPSPTLHLDQRRMRFSGLRLRTHACVNPDDAAGSKSGAGQSERSPSGSQPAALPGLVCGEPRQRHRPFC